ncbi:hypothetical protein BgiMline_018912, partial [Biomphalaria glabrata]
MRIDQRDRHQKTSVPGPAAILTTSQLSRLQSQSQALANHYLKKKNRTTTMALLFATFLLYSVSSVN